MPQIQLVITMDETMAIGVAGPVEQTMICLGMLEMAKEAILSQQRKALSDARIVTPTFGNVPSNFGRNGS